MLALLEHDRLGAGPREVERSSQTVVAPSDHSDIHEYENPSIIRPPSPLRGYGVASPRTRLRRFAATAWQAPAPSHLRTFAPSHLRTLAPSHPRTFAPSHLRILQTSRSIVRAAFLPGAPMMPPPGCVAEPHM